MRKQYPYRHHHTYVKQALHTLSQHGADCYVIFADLVKAYDTVDRELLWKIMARYGCPEELIFVLRKLYTDITVKLKGYGVWGEVYCPLYCWS